MINPGGAAGPFIALFVVGLVIVVGIAYWSYQQNKAKTAAMQQTAAARGWTFRTEAPEYVDSYACAPFGRGRGRRVVNCVDGRYRGVPFAAFEYHYYEEHQTTNAQGHTQTQRTNYVFDVAILRTAAPIPDFIVGPEGFFSRIVDGLTGGDIDVEYDDFNRAYRVRCADRKFAYDTFHARTMEYLLAHPDTELRIIAGDVLLAQRSQGYDPTIWGPGRDDVALAAGSAPFDVALTVLAGIPDFVWQDRGGRPASLRQVTL